MGAMARDSLWSRMFPITTWTKHARCRSAQRAVSESHADLAIAYGKELRHGNGCTTFHLGRREFARARQLGVALPARALGVAVVLNRHGVVVTVIRSHDRHRLRVCVPRYRSAQRPPSVTNGLRIA